MYFLEQQHFYYFVPTCVVVQQHFLEQHVFSICVVVSDRKKLLLCIELFGFGVKYVSECSCFFNLGWNVFLNAAVNWALATKLNYLDHWALATNFLWLFLVCQCSCFSSAWLKELKISTKVRLFSSAVFYHVIGLML